MKKTWILLLFLLLSLYGCQNNQTTSDLLDTDLNTSQKDDYSYQVSSEVFESLFEVNVLVNGKILEIDIQNKKDYESFDYQVSLEISVTYYKNNTHKYYKTDIDLDHDHSNDFIDINFLGDIHELEVYFVNIVSASGQVKSLNKLILPKRNYEEPKFIAKANKIFIDDLEKNKLNYQNLLSDLNDFKERMFDSFTFSTKISAKVSHTSGIESDDQIIVIKIDPVDLYLEQEINQDSWVIQEKSDKLFLYPLLEDDYYNGVYQVNAQVIDSLDDSQGIQFDKNTIDSALKRLDSNKVVFSKISQGYKIEGYAKDVLDPEELEVIIQSYQLLGVAKELIEETMITFEYRLTDNEMELFSKMDIAVFLGNLKTISVTTTEKLTIGDFTKKDLNNESLYRVFPADQIKEVIETTNVLESVESTFRPKPSHFYKVYLEKGQYLVDNSDKSIEILLYDEEGNLEDYNPLKYITFYDRFVFVEESGYYYLEVKEISSAAYDGYSFKLEALNYSSVYNPKEDKYLSLSKQSIEIDGIYDYERLVYEVSEPTLIEIQAIEAGQQLTIYYNHPQISGHSSYHLNEYRPTYIELDVGRHDFIIGGPKAGVYELDISLMDVSQNKVRDFSQLAYMSDHFQGEYVFVSQILGNAYFKIDIDEKSFLSFNFEKFNSLTPPSVSILDKNFEPISYNSFYSDTMGLVLEAGTYVLEISSNMAAGGQIHYVKEKYEDHHKDISIQSFPSLDPYNDSFPYIESRHFDKEHFVYHHFELSETSTIYLSGQKYEIYREDNQLVKPASSANDYSGDYVRLQAGKYYLKAIHSTSSSLRTYRIKIAIIDQDIIDDNHHGSLNNQVGLGSLEFIKNNEFDQEWLKVSVEKNQTYTLISNLTIYIYDQDGKFIKNVFSQDITSLETGSYFIQMPSYSYQDKWTLTID